eukprot:1348349-Heterocapsa_arctica.AAC.1
MSEIMHSDYRSDLEGADRFRACVKHASEQRAAVIEAAIAAAGAEAIVALPAGERFGCARCRRDPSRCLGCNPAKAFAAASRRHDRG